jgi:hypothetical protein
MFLFRRIHGRYVQSLLSFTFSLNGMKGENPCDPGKWKRTAMAQTRQSAVVFGVG